MPQKTNVAQFDLEATLTRKESRTIRKCRGMEQYWIARCPHYNVFDSEEYARAQTLKDTVKTIEEKARKRWDGNFV